MAKRKKEETREQSVARLFDMTRVCTARAKDRHYKSYYTQVMRGEKSLKGEIVQMTPDEFISSPEKSKDVKTEAIPGILVIDKVSNVKYGTNIAEECKSDGVSEIPVLVCK